MPSPEASLRSAAQHRELAPVGKENRHNHADGSGLAGAVRSNEAVQASLRNYKIKIPHGNFLPKRFGYPL